MPSSWRQGCWSMISIVMLTTLAAGSLDDESRCKPVEFAGSATGKYRCKLGQMICPTKFRRIGLQAHTDKVRSHEYQELYPQFFAGEGHDTTDPPSLFEIGLKEGDSVRFWQQLLPGLKLFGLDLKPPEHVSGATLFSGDQNDPPVLQKILTTLGDSSLHYLIDDGAHTNPAILITFHFLWRTVRPGGWYIIEDMAGAYSTASGPFAGCYGECQGGPPGTKNTSIDLIKSVMNSMHNEQFDYETSDGKNDFREIYCIANLCGIQRQYGHERPSDLSLGEAGFSFAPQFSCLPHPNPNCPKESILDRITDRFVPLSTMVTKACETTTDIHFAKVHYEFYPTLFTLTRRLGESFRMLEIGEGAISRALLWCSILPTTEITLYVMGVGKSPRQPADSYPTGCNVRVIRQIEELDQSVHYIIDSSFNSDRTRLRRFRELWTTRLAKGGWYILENMHALYRHRDRHRRKQAAASATGSTSPSPTSTSPVSMVDMIQSMLDVINRYEMIILDGRPSNKLYISPFAPEAVDVRELRCVSGICAIQRRYGCERTRTYFPRKGIRRGMMKKFVNYTCV